MQKKMAFESINNFKVLNETEMSKINGGSYSSGYKAGKAAAKTVKGALTLKGLYEFAKFLEDHPASPVDE